MLERDDEELQPGHELSRLRLAGAIEARTQGRIEPVELDEEELADQVEGRLEPEEALADQALREASPSETGPSALR